MVAGREGLGQAFFEVELLLLGGADAGLQVGGGLALFGALDAVRLSADSALLYAADDVDRRATSGSPELGEVAGVRHQPLVLDLDDAVDDLV